MGGPNVVMLWVTLCLVAWSRLQSLDRSENSVRIASNSFAGCFGRSVGLGDGSDDATLWIVR